MFSVLICPTIRYFRTSGKYGEYIIRKDIDLETFLETVEIVNTDQSLRVRLERNLTKSLTFEARTDFNLDVPQRRVGRNVIFLSIRRSQTEKSMIWHTVFDS